MPTRRPDHRARAGRMRGRPRAGTGSGAMPATRSCRMASTCSRETSRGVPDTGASEGATGSCGRRETMRQGAALPRHAATNAPVRRFSWGTWGRDARGPLRWAQWRTPGVRPNPSTVEIRQVTPALPMGLRGSQPGSAGALAGPTRSIARTIRSHLSGEAQALEVSPGCNQGNPAGEGAGDPRDARGPVAW